MDKILLIDAHNQLWRASIGFGPQKQIHAECGGCNHKLSASQGKPLHLMSFVLARNQANTHFQHIHC